MAVLEGKTPTERNKMIAAVVLGLVALIALYLAFGRTLFGGTTTTVTAKSSPTPKPAAAAPAQRNTSVLPTRTEEDFVYQTTPVVYNPGSIFAPESGRNIFAFYEPPQPTPYVPTPVPIVTSKPATPTPTPVFYAQDITPRNIYAGSQGFRLEVIGDRFTPNARIYFNQAAMPTTYINPQKVVTDIPANLIAQEGMGQVIVQTPDGTAYSEQQLMTVMAPPRPAFQYIGMIGRKRYNNDTAYFVENGKTAPFGARLNDVVSGRFRLVDISTAEVVFEDVSLGFKHRVPLAKVVTTSGQPYRPGQNDSVFPQFTPGGQPICPPGIPCNPQGIPMQPQPKRTPSKDDDVDDNGDGN